MTIQARVMAALASLGLRAEPVKLILGSGEALPDMHITFQVISAAPEAHAEDREIARAHLVQVNLWSQNGFEAFPDVEGAMSAAGFLFQGGRDMELDEETGHYGQSMDFLFYEEKE